MRRNSNRTLRLAGLLVGLLVAPLPRATAAEPAEALFTDSAPLAIRLEAPLGRVIRSKRERAYEPGRLLYADDTGAEQGLDVRVRIRGKSRAEVCSFPPLLLNFRRDGLEGSLFAGQNRLKLVTHCQASSAYEQHLLLEYLAYRVLGLVTDNALLARLVDVRYFDSEREREVAAKPGILLEDEERFGERMGLSPLEVQTVERGRYDQSALVLLEIFQYFIGNTDWSAIDGPGDEQCCHNVVPYARADGVLIPVPYDFDSSGFVNAPHAFPDERLPIRTVRQRLYRGPCRAPEELAPALERFTALRGQIAMLFDDPRLAERTRSEALSYVEEFYVTIGSAERVDRALRSSC